MNVYYMSKKNDEIYHFGIKGMKWGVRRWQNADGTLTEAGKAKYGSVENYEKAKADRNRKIKTGMKVVAALAIGAISVKALVENTYSLAFGKDLLAKYAYHKWSNISPITIDGKPF